MVNINDAQERKNESLPARPYPFQSLGSIPGCSSDSFVDAYPSINDIGFHALISWQFYYDFSFFYESFS
jgi:hypothetical protein